MEPVPVRVHQILSEVHAGYLIRCPRTRAAALVDPLPTMHPAFTSLVERHELKLRFVLRTGRAQAAVSSRYGQMIAGLGLGPVDEHEPAGPDPYAEIPHVGPTDAPEGSERAAPEAMILQAGEGTIGVRLFDGVGPQAPRFTVGGSLLGGQPPTAHICGSARVALGAFFVDVLPVNEAQVAYLVQDRLFSGGPVGQSDPGLLGLWPDTIIYPNVVGDTGSVTTIGHECRARPGVARPGEAAEWPG